MIRHAYETLTGTRRVPVKTICLAQMLLGALPALLPALLMGPLMAPSGKGGAATAPVHAAAAGARSKRPPGLAQGALGWA